jgi:putative component of membrane protein insertase Oxa1/YidC/SpoIIIJ protein YidD
MYVIAHRARSVLVFLITLYQKYISPIKGFRCAYHILHQGESCSEFVKRNLLEQDLITAVKLSQVRFKKCSEAAFELSKQQRRQRSSDLIPTNTVKIKLPKLRGRRHFLLVVIPAFLVGLASPALAARSPKAAPCARQSARAGYHEDMEDGDCGDPNVCYGLCCILSIVGSMANSQEK